MLVRNLGCAVLVVMLCVTSELPAETPPLATTPQKVGKPALQKKKLGEIRLVHALGDIYLASQPTVADLAVFKQQGIKTVITLRKANEVPWDEAAFVKKLGMNHVQVPFMQPAELKPEVFEQVFKVLRDKKRGPTVLHCGSANRVGAIWYAHRMLDGKLSAAAALKEAQVVGLRTPAYLERAKAYVDQVQQARMLPAK